MAIQIATALQAELDILVCRKLAIPLNPEGGLGAVADDGTFLLNEDVITRDGITPEQIEFEAGQIKENVKQRSLKYRSVNRPAVLFGKIAIVVDDGLASGITMTVAVQAVKHRRPSEVVAAIPIASATGFERVSKVADRVLTCAVASMKQFYMADFYRNWRDLTDDEVLHQLKQWKQRVTSLKL